jgi:hypothetical protein
MKLRAEDSQDESRVKPVFNYFFRWCQARLIVGLAVIIFAGFTVPAHAAITCSLPAMVTPNFGSSFLHVRTLHEEGVALQI